MRHLIGDATPELGHLSEYEVSRGAGIVVQIFGRFRANSATAGPIESITLRDICHGSDLAAHGHSLTARRTHTASDIFVILKAGRSARVGRHQRALPLIIDPCPAPDFGLYVRCAPLTFRWRQSSDTLLTLHR